MGEREEREEQKGGNEGRREIERSYVCYYYRIFFR